VEDDSTVLGQKERRWPRPAARQEIWATADGVKLDRLVSGEEYRYVYLGRKEDFYLAQFLGHVMLGYHVTLPQLTERWKALGEAELYRDGLNGYPMLTSLCTLEKVSAPLEKATGVGRLAWFRVSRTDAHRESGCGWASIAKRVSSGRDRRSSGKPAKVPQQVAAAHIRFHRRTNCKRGT